MKTSGAAKRAFTLLEVMIAVGIFGLVMAGSIGVYVMCQKMWRKTALGMQTAREAGLALDRMVYGMGGDGGLRAAATIVIHTNRYHKCSGFVNYWDSITSSPPAATDSANNFCSTLGYPDGSWRIEMSNVTDGVKWIDYIKRQRSIVLWRTPNQQASRVSVCNHVVDSAIATNLDGRSGLNIQLTVARRDGVFSATNNVGTFVKKRNK